MVCLFIGPINWNSTGNVIRIVANFKADELSSITVPGCMYLRYLETDWTNFHSFFLFRLNIYLDSMELHFIQERHSDEEASLE